MTSESLIRSSFSESALRRYRTRHGVVEKATLAPERAKWMVEVKPAKPHEAYTETSHLPIGRWLRPVSGKPHQPGFVLFIVDFAASVLLAERL